MSDEPPNPDARPRPVPDGRARREAALAAALRANLKRRKAPSPAAGPAEPYKDETADGEPLPPPRRPG